jgi:hypothetical protein
MVMRQSKADEARKFLKSRKLVNDILLHHFVAGAILCIIFLVRSASANPSLHSASISSISPSNQPTTGTTPCFAMCSWCNMYAALHVVIIF